MAKKTMKHTQVRIDKRDSILYVALARPESHNALSPEIIASLTEIFTGIEKDKSIHAVILSGDGPSFCAGGDLNWMRKTQKFTLAQNLKDTQKLSNMYETIFQCPVPVMALLQGSVMGGGVGLASVCDIVAAEVDTKFCLSEVRLGLVPSIISPYVLRKVPESQAKPLMLTAEVFKAPHAQHIGLVHFIGSRAETEAFVNERVNLIKANAPEATRIAKNLIHKIQTSSWGEKRKLTVKTIAHRRVSKEGQEGMAAFFEKRSPAWRRGE